MHLWFLTTHRSVHKCGGKALGIKGWTFASVLYWFSDFIVELHALVKVHPNLSLVVNDYKYLFRKILCTEVSMFLEKQKGVQFVCLITLGVASTNYLVSHNYIRLSNAINL